MHHKQCTKCGKIKPLEEFHRHRLTHDGRRQPCAECRSTKSVEQRKRDQIRVKGIQICSICGKTSEEVSFTKGTRRCKSCNSTYLEKYYKRNRNIIITRANKWIKDNPEKSAQHRRTSYKRHRKRILEAGKKWREENKDRMAKLKKEWRHKNPIRFKAYAHKRREAIKAPLSGDDVQRMFVLYPFCLACSAEKDLEIDHIVPLSRGGTNEFENLQVLCGHCNRSKGQKAVDYRTDPPRDLESLVS